MHRAAARRHALAAADAQSREPDMKIARASCTLLLALSATCSIAQSNADFPTKPVRMLVGFSPGSEADVFARVIGNALADVWGQRVVIDNRAGAGTTLAAR